MGEKIKQTTLDILWTLLAGIIVGMAYYFFQNSNGFAPGGVGGLATITYHFTGNFIGESLSWTVLMLAFNMPIFALVTIFVNRKLGFILILYMTVQTGITVLYETLGWKPYSLANNGEDFHILFACIATGVISGVGFSMML
ncbi:MAG: YitT family protein, partial [Clostridia bacterium]|nr:YitT family protein [Clostridia bacterium]